jgi:capsular exopolysaccharide synthesis family protein
MTQLNTRDHVPQIARPPTPAGVHPAIRPAPQPQAPGLTARDLMRMLRKRIWFILGSVATCVVLAAAATFLWQSYWPLYSSEAMLIVSPPASNVMRDPSIYGKDVMERLVVQWARLARSRQVIDEALKDEDVQRTNWYRRGKDTAAARLADDVRVTPATDANAVYIALTDLDRQEVSTIVQAVADAAEKRALDLTQGQRRTETAKLTDEYNAVVEALRTTRSRMATNRPGDMPFMQDRINVLSLELGALVSNQTSLAMAETEAESELRNVQEQEARGGLERSPEVQRWLESDPTLRSLEFSKMQITNERDASTQKYGPKHRIVVNLESRLASLTEQIADRQRELVATGSRVVKAEAEGKLGRIRAQLQLVQEQLNEKKATFKDLETTLLRMRELEQQEKNQADSAARLEARLQELRLTQNVEKPLYVGRRAETPNERTHPKWWYMLAGGLMLGLAFGVGISLLLELGDTSIKSANDVSRRTDMPVLGMIPHLDDIDDEIADTRLAFSTNPHSLIGEAFRQIRTCLQFSGPPDQRRSLLITSPLPADGRTTVALNLAAAFARSEKRVLVVDANFRQPMIRGLFPACPPAGLSSALVGQADWRTLVQAVEPNLWVMASGPLPPNPAELLGSRPMREMVQQMAAEYDHVIFDGAPCLVVTDSAVLSTLVDGVVMTVRAGENSYGIVQRARDTVTRVGGRILGVALNGVRAAPGGYLRKNYETFYEYHETAAAADAAPAAQLPPVPK